MVAIITTLYLQRQIQEEMKLRAKERITPEPYLRYGYPYKADVVPEIIAGCYRQAYKLLSESHNRTKWLLFEDKPDYLTKLDYIAAKGGKPIMEELLNIAKNLNKKTEPIRN